ncbi:hypothetical protein PACTADRAFT_48174 [Pachysolen tannophilus NRRL Y-2460]|uniref:Transcription factor TFIID subunit 8 C-terminal domain-containing protein n=1 Tax=Pachysolen tannophilus NRRL Y-2460 TaxID=669874 RepID=A0A1E4U323_PACTA|nr:hypothetical protein PACTADRAFT_48174 [Pachysolen tannophilus NRRL Y-2460]
MSKEEEDQSVIKANEDHDGKVDDDNKKVERSKSVISMPSHALKALPAQVLTKLNVEKVEETPVDLIFSNSIMLLLSSYLNINSFTSLSIQKLLGLAKVYLNQLILHLKKFMEFQRRRKPALRDLKLLIRLFGLDFSGIDEDVLKFRELSKTQDFKLKFNKISNDSIRFMNNVKQEQEIQEDEIDPLDPSSCFFLNQSYEIKNLVPSSYDNIFSLKHLTHTSSLILPELPPDYTFKSTPQFTENYIENVNFIREKLLQESRLGEKALEHLSNGYGNEINDEVDLKIEEADISESDKSDVEKELESEEPKTVAITSDQDNGRSLGLIDELPKIEEDGKIQHSLSIEKPKDEKNTKEIFDIEKFAAKRLKKLQEKKQQKLKFIEEFKQNKLNKISLYLGSYSTKTIKDNSIAVFIDDYMNDVLKDSIENLKKYEILKYKRDLKEGKRKKKLLEKNLLLEKKRRLNNFEFGEEEDEEIVDFEFNFDDDIDQNHDYETNAENKEQDEEVQDLQEFEKDSFEPQASMTDIIDNNGTHSVDLKTSEEAQG